MGGALALALSKKEYRIAAIVSRSKKSARELAGQTSQDVKVLSISQLNSLPASDVILITTPDTEIASTAEKLALIKKIRTWKPVILHTSGSLSSEILLPLKEIGCAIGSVHPLASISEPQAGTKRFRRAYFCVEGDREAQRTTKQIVRDLHGREFSLETKYKPLYHAAAIMTSGHTTALFSTAIDTLTKCGLSPEKARAVLLPLLKGTIENLEKQIPAQALTGTFARVDSEAFERHIKLLAENAGEDVLKIYLLLGKVSLKLAEEQGADEKRVKVFKQKINKKLTS